MSATKEVVRFGPLQEYIPNAVRTGEAIYLSGQIALDDAGEVVGHGDVFAQMRQAYVNIAAALERLGASMDDIVDEMMLVTDIQAVMGDLEAFGRVRAEAYGGEPDVTQTLVQVAGLVFPELLVEIKCIARIG